MRPRYLCMMMLAVGAACSPTSEFLPAPTSFVLPYFEPPSRHLRPESLCRDGWLRGGHHHRCGTSSRCNEYRGHRGRAAPSLVNLKQVSCATRSEDRWNRTGVKTSPARAFLPQLGAQSSSEDMRRRCLIMHAGRATLGMSSGAFLGHPGRPVAAAALETMPNADEAPMASCDGENDPTAVAHSYLRSFLEMTDQDIKQLSENYRKLPSGRRNPDEITVADPELATAAAAAGEAAASAVLVEALTLSPTATPAAELSAPSDPEISRRGASDVGTDRRCGASPFSVDDGDGPDGVEDGHSRVGGADCGREDESWSGGEAVRLVDVRVAAERAAAAAAGQVLIPEVPGIASILHLELGVSKERAKRLVLKWPRLLEVSRDNLDQSVRWLLETLGVGRDDAARLMITHPPILIKSVERQLETNLRWLEGDLGLTRVQVRKVVCSCPQLLTKSWSSNLTPKLNFFEREMGLGRGQIKVMLLRYPQLLNFSPTNMAWKARYLAEETQMNAVDLRGVLRRCPSLFAYSVERNLVPTLQFFSEELGATRMQIRTAILKQPRLLGTSLEKRLLPRAQSMRAAGVTPSWHVHHTVIIFAGDDVFRRWLEKEARGGDHLTSGTS